MDRNGIELWRQSNLQRAPKTKGRAFRILGAYMNYRSFNKCRSLFAGAYSAFGASEDGVS